MGVLEYLPGGELFDILYYTSALSERIARTYFKQLMDGMEACHEAGICHRDIKPQNLLLDANFQLKIADFGLAKVFEKDEDALMRTFYVGTRGYQSPEILKKKEYTASCDVFSCGVVLFILLAGYPPFEAATPKCRWYAPFGEWQCARVLETAPRLRHSRAREGFDYAHAVVRLQQTHSDRAHQKAQMVQCRGADGQRVGGRTAQTAPTDGNQAQGGRREAEAAAGLDQARPDPLH